jgi:hypothetical protein
VFVANQEVYHSLFGAGTVVRPPTDENSIAEVKFLNDVRSVRPESLKKMTDTLRTPPPQPPRVVRACADKEAEMLRMLKVAGPKGVVNLDFVNNDIIGHRFSVTVQSLRDKGYGLETIKLDRRTFKTVLVSEPE